MAELIPGNRFNVLIHAAAVGDYHLAGSYAPVTGAHFDPMSAAWTNGKLVDVSAGKVKSHHAELWLRLTPTPKLADMVRKPWGFSGTFVKFKLEVGATDAELREVRCGAAQPDADLIVANMLEGKGAVAWIGDRTDGGAVERAKLAVRLLVLIDGCNPPWRRNSILPGRGGGIRFAWPWQEFDSAGPRGDPGRMEFRRHEV